jgi:hypothetical protein
MTAITSPNAQRSRTWQRGLLTIPAITGIAFTLSWVVGLSVKAPSPSFSASGSAIVTEIAGHSAALTAQILFTEGLPAIGLAIVPLALARAARWNRPARVVAIAAIAAAAISIAQFIAGVSLAHATSSNAAHLLFAAVNRPDGIKMFLLAVLAVAAAATGLLPRWLRWIGIAMAALLVFSGIGYLLLIPGLANIAYIDGPMLLVFITGAGILLGRKDSLASQ